jgi:hypothetical protein
VQCHRLGWILAEYIELTDKYSTLRGPPRSAGFLRVSIEILEGGIWPAVD